MLSSALAGLSQRASHAFARLCRPFTRPLDAPVPASPSALRLATQFSVTEGVATHRCSSQWTTAMQRKRSSASVHPMSVLGREAVFPITPPGAGSNLTPRKNPAACGSTPQKPVRAHSRATRRTSASGHVRPRKPKAPTRSADLSTRVNTRKFRTLCGLDDSRSHAL